MYFRAPRTEEDSLLASSLELEAMCPLMHFLSTVFVSSHLSSRQTIPKGVNTQLSLSRSLFRLK